MRTIYLTWLDDRPGFIPSLEEKLELLELDKKVKFEIDAHSSSKDFDAIARNIDDDLIFLIDYNLKDNNGNGLDGDEVIKLIRKHNKACIIIFYSEKATQFELRALIEGLEGIYPISRGNIMDQLRKFCD